MGNARYINDNGFLNLGVNRSKNSGNILENLVFNVLSQRYEDVTYLKDKYEIDFCTNDSLYQVSFSIDDEKTKQRELNAFRHFNKDAKKRNILITYDADEQIEDVAILSLEKFIFE